MLVDQAKLQSLLNEVFGETAVTRLGGNEATYHCPFCGHDKRKLEISLNNSNGTFGYYHCWTCNVSGKSLRSLFKKLKVSHTYFTRLYDITKDRKPNIKQAENFKEEDRKLPDTFIPLYNKLHDWNGSTSPHLKHAVKYLYSRGIPEVDIFRYNIGYSESGEYSGRIIIPSYDASGNLNFFSSRAFYDSISYKHKTPNWNKDIIGFEIFINWDEDISICEGAFDALAIRKNAIPLFGKTMNFALKEAIVRNGVGRVNIVLDNDAKIDAMGIQDFLTSYEVSVHLIKLEDKDPSVLGFSKISKIIQESEPTDFHKLVSMKLFE